MSTTSASSLFFHTLYPKAAASISDPTKPALLSFSSSSSSSSVSSLKSIPALSRSFTHLKSQLSSRLIRNVAVSSEFGQEEEVWSGDEERSLSPDLKLFVGNLPFSVDSAQLAGVFESAGNVEMVEVIYDKMTGRSRGFGFVTMSTAEEAEAAAQQFNGYELEGRALRVNNGPPPQRESFSPRPRAPRGGGESFDSANRVFVGNLSWGVDNLALETLFSEQGKVMEARVVYDKETGRSRGFGFVTFSSAEEVDNAIDSLNGFEVDGRAIRVAVADAKPKRQF